MTVIPGIWSEDNNETKYRYTCKLSADLHFGYVHPSHCTSLHTLAKYFPIISDEATDVAIDEQLSICIHNVEEGVPQEMFVAFYECVSGVTDEAISEIIISNLAVWQLQPYLLRGEAYDGGGGMSGLSNDLLGDWHDA